MQRGSSFLGLLTSLPTEWADNQIIGKRGEQPHESLALRPLGVEPSGVVVWLEDDRHPVVHHPDDAVGLARDERARLDGLVALLPPLVEPGEREGVLVLE